MIDLTDKKWCYYIPADQRDEHGYIPSLVVENEAGHSPMTGDPARMQSPWHWGETLDVARQVCKEYNERLGISEEEASRIIISSMKAQGAIR